MAEELSALDRALGTPSARGGHRRAGAKVSTKLDLLNNLVGKVDHLVIGGAMANTFLHAQGYPVGHSLHEPDLAETARGILRAPRRRAARSCCRATSWWPRSSGRRARKASWARTNAPTT
jgi:3-phosphoglycerate kinase